MEIRQCKHSYITNYAAQNIEEYADCLKEFGLRIMQLSKGSFQGRTGIIKLRDFSLIRRTSIAKYSMTGCFEGAINFVFPIISNAIFYNGCNMDNGRQIVSTSHDENYAIIPECFDQLIISIPRQSISQYLSPTETEFFLAQASIIGNTKIDARQKSILTRKLFDIFEFSYASPVPLTGENMLGMCQTIIGLLFDFLMIHQRHRHARRSSHEKILERTIRLVESDTTSPITLEKISKEIFASKRAIQCAFTSILGISPMRYAKLCRINQVRSELGDVIAGLNFTELVTRYSFSNVSRLCREYQEHFGEHPKETHRHIAFSRSFA